MKKFEIKKQAIAGTLESSDLQIILDEGSNGIEINLKSSVEYQFGKRIRTVITETLGKLGIDNARVDVVDKGALDCTIIARTVAAAHRAADIAQDYDWEELDTWTV